MAAMGAAVAGLRCLRLGRVAGRRSLLCRITTRGTVVVAAVAVSATVAAVTAAVTSVAT
jgi:hypothetical protein